MELLLIRHAIAYERDARRWRNDDARPLSLRGKARAHKAAAGLKCLVARPAYLLTSPLVRTRQTADLLSKRAAWPRPTSCPELAPGSSPRAFLEILVRHGGARIAAVGHEPDLGRLLGLLLYGDGRYGQPFKKMGAALVHLGDAIQPGSAQLVWFAPPRLLRAAR